MAERVAVACLSGPDTSAVGRLAGTGAEVVAVAVDLGQGEDLEAIRDRALACGAVEAVLVDARDEFAERYCLPALKANALSVDGSALARPLIVKHLADAAQRHGAATAGPDEAGIARGNVWTPTTTRNPVEPRDPDELVLTFDRGVPVAIDGETVTVLQALRELNRRAGEHGVGPGATALITAHRELEEVTLERDLARFKRQVEQRWGELVHGGLWFSPLKHALDGFIGTTQEHVSGEIRLALHAGRAVVTGRRGELYDLATKDFAQL